MWKLILLLLIASVQSYTYYSDDYDDYRYEEEHRGLETQWIILIVIAVIVKIIFWSAMCVYCSRRNSASNRTVYVTRSVQSFPGAAARAGDAALYPTQNDGKTVIVNNDYNAQPAGYI